MRGLRIVLLAVLVSYTLQSEAYASELIHPDSPLFYMFALISFGLSCFAGICSGLTVGYMSISQT